MRMSQMARMVGIALCAVLLASLAGAAAWAQKPDLGQGPLAAMAVEPGVITWLTQVESGAWALTVSGPDGFYLRQELPAGSIPTFGAKDGLGGSALRDGSYTYELQALPAEARSPEGCDEARRGLEPSEPARAIVQSGSFSVLGGAFVTPGALEEAADGKSLERVGLEDVLHYDDVIITGSLCTGFDCQDGESFGFDTHIFKEHNLRLYFNDTSYTASYPTNSWRITINDSTNGGASYFSVDDVDDGTSIFKIEAGAPSNSLYVEDYGRVGLGTSTPVVELHIKDSDTPTTRLEQDSSGGWTAQTWDVAGNESNFFVRDATNGSKLPFRIQPSTPSSTLCLKSDGKVGIGTWSPAYALEVETTNENAAIVADRTDGAMNFMNATASYAQFGSVSNHPLRLLVNSAWKMKVDSNTDIEMADGGTYDGNWNNASSIAYKEGVRDLSAQEAMGALLQLEPVTYRYKTDQIEEHVGFIAEDVPELVASNDRKTLSPMDIVAVLTKVVQEQQNSIEALEAQNSDLQARLAALEGLAEKRKLQ